jgi:hypothetical protein
MLKCCSLLGMYKASTWVKFRLLWPGRKRFGLRIDPLFLVVGSSESPLSSIKAILLAMILNRGEKSLSHILDPLFVLG